MIETHAAQNPAMNTLRAPLQARIVEWLVAPGDVVRRGDVLVAADQPAEVADQFEARLLWMHEHAMTPGRQYLMKLATKEVTATVTATAPVVRPGSYFNAARSGHGLFLYPAGSARVGLWYTYLEDGTSTWYYLQAPAPGLDGLWTSPVYRAAWDGGRNVLTEAARIARGDVMDVRELKAEQFDALIHIDETHALEPLDRGADFFTCRPTGCRARGCIGCCCTGWTARRAVCSSRVRRKPWHGCASCRPRNWPRSLKRPRTRRRADFACWAWRSCPPTRFL